jgi:hypothetical protein
MKILLPVAAVLFGGSLLLVDSLDGVAAEARRAKQARPDRPKVQLDWSARPQENPVVDLDADTGHHIHPAPSR